MQIISFPQNANVGVGFDFFVQFVIGQSGSATNFIVRSHSRAQSM